MSTKLPSALPLPEVPNYTDVFSFDGLALPVGFDQERLLINLRGLDRIRIAGVLGDISVITDRGEPSHINVQVSGVSSSGIATLSGIGTREVESMATNRYHSRPESYGPDTTIGINNTELEDRVRDEIDKYDRGLVDPKGWAKHLNRGIKTGLSQAVSYGLYGPETPPQKIVLPLYAAWFGINLAATHRIEESLIATEGFFQFVSFLTIGLVATSDDNKMKAIKEAPWSILPLVNIDRYLVANGLIKTTRLVRARK